MPEAMNVQAIEDLLLSGSWLQALQQSKQALAHHLHNGSTQADTSPSTLDRLFEMYTRCIFELEMQDEVDTATSIYRSLPSPSSSARTSWVLFLTSMERSNEVSEYLDPLLEELYSSNTIASRKQYYQLLELSGNRSLSYPLPELIQNDLILDDATKQDMVGRLQAQQEESQRTTSAASLVSEDKTAFNASWQNLPNTKEPSTSSRVDDFSYSIIGAGVISLAIAAGVGLRYREQVAHAVADVPSALSQGLQDLKQSLF